jgi:hypothetical protein
MNFQNSTNAWLNIWYHIYIPYKGGNFMKNKVLSILVLTIMILSTSTLNVFATELSPRVEGTLNVERSYEDAVSLEYTTEESQWEYDMEIGYGETYFDFWVGKDEELSVAGAWWPADYYIYASLIDLQTGDTLDAWSSNYGDYISLRADGLGRYMRVYFLNHDPLEDARVAFSVTIQ